MSEFSMPYFRLTVPSSWSDETTYVITGVEDRETGYRPSIVVQHRERKVEQTLAEVVEAELAAVGEELPEPELIERGAVEGCQVAAEGATWTMITEEEFEVYQRQVYMQTESRLYILTCTCLKSERKMMDEAFLRVIRSFQPKG
jgi:hypothetical protein